jgi:hypothetical protein
VKVDGEGLVIQIDQLMKQNQINFSLLATIPTVLLLTFLTMTFKNILTNRLVRQRRYDASTIRQQIIRRFRQIEHVLMLNSEQPALTMHGHELLVNEPIDDEYRIHLLNSVTYGQLLSLVYELKSFVDQLKSKQLFTQEFDDDIHLLTCAQLSVKQKQFVIEQIFRSYSFLVAP